jgi:glycosyltransferase involved in cell wall biosynthesis
MGNCGPFHERVFDLLQRCPGVVVLHDLVVRDFFFAYCLAPGRGGVAHLRRLMDECHGPAAVRWLQRLFSAQPASAAEDPRLLQCHMARAAVGPAHGIVTHSEFARREVAPLAGSPVVRIDFPSPPLADAAVGWEIPAPRCSDDPVALLTVGTVQANKLIHEVIETLAGSALLRNRVNYTVVGPADEEAYAARLHRLIRQHRLEDRVHLAGRQPEDQLHEYLRSADVVVNLRYPHMGESSWSLLEALFAGKATVVWDHGYYAEFPDEVVVKVSSREALAISLEHLVRHPEQQRKIGAAAREHAQRRFDTVRYCANLLEFVQSLGPASPVLRLADTVGALIAEMAVAGVPDALLDRLAAELALLT